jgi:hypothetical protein
MLLKKQKPIALFFSAWWPGGREATKALSALPENTVVDGRHRAADAGQGRLQAGGLA